MESTAFNHAAYNPLLTIGFNFFTLHGIHCIGAGVMFRLLRKKSVLWASFAAAATAPILNTGLFILGGLTLVADTLSGFTSDSVLVFLVIGCAGVNFLVEFAVNMILSPGIYRIITAIRRV